MFLPSFKRIPDIKMTQKNRPSNLCSTTCILWLKL